MLKHVLMSGLLVTLIALQGCGGGARPYSAMHKAAESELSPAALARDHHLKAELRTALVSEEGLSGVMLRSEEHTSELQSHVNLVCRLLLEKKKNSTSC